MGLATSLAERTYFRVCLSGLQSFSVKDEFELIFVKELDFLGRLAEILELPGVTALFAP